MHVQALIDWIEQGLVDKSNCSPKKSRKRVDSPVHSIQSDAEEDFVNADHDKAIDNDAELANKENNIVPTNTNSAHKASSSIPNATSGVTVEKSTSNKPRIAGRGSDGPPSVSGSDGSTESMSCFLSNKKIRCIHLKLNPTKGYDTRYISKVSRPSSFEGTHIKAKRLPKDAHEKIVESGATLDHPFSKEDICESCVEKEHSREYH